MRRIYKEVTYAQAANKPAYSKFPNCRRTLVGFRTSGAGRNNVRESGVSDRIGFDTERRIRLAGGRIRRADDPHSVQRAASSPADSITVSRTPTGTHAGVRAAVVVGRRSVLPGDRTSAI